MILTRLLKKAEKGGDSKIDGRVCLHEQDDYSLVYVWHDVVLSEEAGRPAWREFH